MKLNNQIVWELIFKVVEMLDLKVIMHKVKAHSNNKWNDRADEEANEGRNKDTLLLIKNSYSKHKYQMQYYGINIDTNPRSFIKKMNDIHIQKEFDNLNRNSEFSIAEVDKNLSLKIIKEKYRKKGITMSRFRNFKDHNLKAFNVKKLMNELPTLENLKKRRPDLYAENLKCIRCNEEQEDLEHLWKCKMVSNDMLFIGLKSKRFLNKILSDEKKKDEIIEALHKYTRLEKEMNIFNTEENTKYYRDQRDINYDKVYIWDGKYSLDSLLRGWIPRELYQIMKKFISRKKKIENILSRWIVKINKWFFDRIWKHRNEKLIEWELKHNISNKDKRTSMKRKREIRIDKMIKVKEKRDINRIDTYHEIKQLCFFSKNWIRGHSYHVLLILVNKFNTLTDCINYLVIYTGGSI
jgi:hypothetical protein